MDPLSITASAITLIHAAGSITSSLCGFVQSVRNADSRISSLCDELKSLTSFLEVVDRTLKGCRPLDLALVEDDLWRQSELALVDCQLTLNSLGVLVDKIKGTTKARRFGWRARAVVDLSIHAADLANFRDKIHKSNWALQTMLHTITVSTSLRTQASQEEILFELDRLKSSIDQALSVSVRPAGGFVHNLGDWSDARVSRNLRKLAEAAKHFHSAASSTASTVRDGSSSQWQPYTGVAVSLMGDFPSYRRERVEMFLREGHTLSPGQNAPVRARSSLRSLPLISPAALDSATGPEGVAASQEDDEDDEDEFERLFLDGLVELAADRIKNHDFAKATEFLKEAMGRQGGPSAGDSNFRHLRIQLVLCHFFRRDWRLAEPVIDDLAEMKAGKDLIICNLLHALSLAYLSEYSFDNALATCRQALQGKKRLFKANRAESLEYGETLGLLATIYDMSGDYIRAEVFRRQLPANFAYHHPASEVEYIVTHPNLLLSVLGQDNIPDFGIERQNLPVVGSHELNASPVETAHRPTRELRREHGVGHGNVSPLRTKFVNFERYEADTSKEVVFDSPSSGGETDADDEASTNPPTPTSPLKRTLTRMLGTRRRPREDTEADLTVRPVDSSPTSSPSRWFKGAYIFSLRKSKRLLRKKAGDVLPPGMLAGGRPPKTFRLLHVERMASVKLSDPNHHRRLMEPFPDVIDSTSRPAPFTTRNGVLYADVSGRRRNWTRPTGMANPEWRAELPENSVHNSTRPEGINRETLLEVPIAELHDDWVTSVTRPDMIEQLGGHRSAHRLRRLHQAVCTSGSSAKDYWADLARAKPSGILPPAAPTEGGIDISAAEARVALTAGYPAEASPLSARRHELLKQLANIIGSLPEATEEERHTAKLDLEVLSRNFSSLCNDAVLGHDLQSVIQCLGEKQNKSTENAYDSGYESIDNSQSDAELDTETSGSLFQQSREATPTASASPDGDSDTLDRSLVLTRTYSWIASAEAAFTTRPLAASNSANQHCRTCSPSAQTRKGITPAQSPKERQVSWAPETDYPDEAGSSEAEAEEAIEWEGTYDKKASTTRKRTQSRKRDRWKEIVA